MDFSKLKVADLKKELKNRGLSTVGNKNELQERLQLATLENDAALDPNISELLDEDVLNDDDLDDEDKSLLAEDSSHIEDESLLSTSSHSTKAESQPVTATSEPAQTEKKIVLKRTVPITAPTTTPSVTSGDEAKASESATDEPSPKVVKLTQLTAAERLELRTKKFGASAAPLNTELKKQARAERFGLKSTEPAAKEETAKPETNKKPAGSNKIDTSTLEAASVEVLKKRAERFGAVSSKLIEVEKSEKLAKRQDRFGTAATAVTAPAPTTTTKAAITAPNGAAKPVNDFAERAKLRLERFKQEVK